ncbi:hypothetical protein B0H14DRAFT_556562 [Mycena olivaceomarginata]|nr:hypothetical protein B0H14DRAFT_556562 [Mycena olivaceomarginata]
MTGFLNVEAGWRGACVSLLLYSALTAPCDRSPGVRPSLSIYAGSSSRSCSSSGPTRSSCASRPASSMHRFPRDARLHRFRVCTPPMLAACIPIATFVRCWLSHRGHRRTSREELQTTSCTPLRLIIVLGGYDGRDFSRDT